MRRHNPITKFCRFVKMVYGASPSTFMFFRIIQDSLRHRVCTALGIGKAHIESVRKPFLEAVQGGSYSTQWVDRHIPVWVRVLERLDFGTLKPRILEIGSWEGRSAILFMTLFGQCELTAADPWEDVPEFMGVGMLMAEVEKRFDANTNAFQPYISKLKGYSKDLLPGLQASGQLYDLIYVDGSHEYENVLFDAHGVWPLLKAGGIIIFDDYLEATAGAVNHFLSGKKGKYRLLVASDQLIAQKLT